MTGKGAAHGVRLLPPVQGKETAMYNTMLFIDFDGTITAEETLEGAMRLCVDPAAYAEKEKEMLAGRTTLAEAVRYAFSQIPSSRLEDIKAYVRGVPIRPGFGELLQLAKEQGIPAVVISGGLRPCVEEKLAPWRELLLDVYSVALDCSGDTMRLVSDYEGDGEILSKVRVMGRYEYRHAICVGDSYTDIKMARASQTVFARDTLARTLEKLDVPYTPWSDFFDVARAISSSR